MDPEGVGLARAQVVSLAEAWSRVTWRRAGDVELWTGESWRRLTEEHGSYHAWRRRVGPEDAAAEFRRLQDGAETPLEPGASAFTRMLRSSLCIALCIAHP